MVHWREESRSEADGRVDWTRITRLLAAGSFLTVLATLVSSVVLAGTIGVDLGVFQLGGELAADGAWSELYNGDAFSSRFQAELFPSLAEEATLNTFISTPSFALAVQPLAWLPFSVALMMWTLLTIGICAACVRVLGLGRAWALGLVLSPALAVNLAIGQSAALFILLMVSVHLALRSGRGFVAGIGLGLLFALKPPLAVGYALLWLVSLRRSARPVAGALVGAGLAIVPTLLNGTGAWSSFLDATRSRVAIESSWQLNGVSLPEALKLLNPEADTWFTLAAWTVSLVVGGALLATAYRRWSGDPELLSGSAVLVTVLVSPHLAVYDTALLIIPLSVLWRRGLSLDRVAVLVAIHGATLAFGRAIFDAQFDLLGRGMSVEFLGYATSLVLLYRWRNEDVSLALVGGSTINEASDNGDVGVVAA